MLTRLDHDRDGRVEIDQLLVSLAAEFGPYRVRESSVVTESRTRSGDVPAGVDVAVQFTTPDGTVGILNEGGEPFEVFPTTSWDQDSSLRVLCERLSDHFHCSSIDTIDIAEVTVRIEHLVEKPASVTATVTVTAELESRGASRNLRWIPASELTLSGDPIQFDAPPEIKEAKTIGNPDVGLRTRSRLQVDALLVVLAAEYGEFRVREPIWELSETEYEQFRTRYDNGAAGGAGIWATDDQGRVVLVKHEGDDAWSEPGGKREAGETFATAARREFDEETGLTPTISGVQEVHPILHRSVTGNAEAIVSPIVVFRGSASGIPGGRTGEIAAAEWWDHRPENLLYDALSEFPVPATE